MFGDMNMKKTKVAIVGASGYSGEELVRLLLGHPGAELVAVTSRQHAGKSLAEIFPRYEHFETARNLMFVEPDCDELARVAEIVFLALPHGVAYEFAGPLVAKGTRVIDLSADFRLRSKAVYEEFYGAEHPSAELLPGAVYGLPEVYREAIKSGQLIASPGCYPTSILLPTIPLLKAGMISPDGIIANSLSGVSGAGRKAAVDFLFVECNESARPYGVPKHRHLSEIEQELSIAAGRDIVVQFVPHLIPVNRGILTTLYLSPAGAIADASFAEGVTACYEEAYADEPFVRLLGTARLPDTKNVVGTNFIEIAWKVDPRTQRLIVMSAEDNIIKGAGGQAIQSLNIICGFPETMGLI